MCIKCECEENVTLKPWTLGLFIGQGLGFKGMYLKSRPSICEGWMFDTCRVSAMEQYFGMFRHLSLSPVVDRCVLSLSCQSVLVQLSVWPYMRPRVRAGSTVPGSRDHVRVGYPGWTGGRLDWLVAFPGRTPCAGSGFGEPGLYPIIRVII